ncbi:3-sulfolactaldehyde dehydrogenase [Fulvia fulva]|uniref:3-sulfolactaldehyde dehydrogenase n=1 Tax=Passalora fulva TaxID=5499 RepID=A0A9Q8LI96_PASFU|nr:3-sulfolactaldehyde dehydrogenase [Fulvia fulva]KAK4623738.1 3-sulfolactaldehyde dehydrogenase [Fulvia fulva]KAK4625580.1 3-sulfolactaldehyde dehydrogenase [Fulvia fulva]UJO17990.1 3-sulfolactaldehyde dehydrogenase [Fulvia fulva]WPV14626.1 3-sulfolactaldehyde dehydrogenase [Fulvia fulva]WPV30158.1 3-sulfolactaldehyde dehydrogenase [Fulvia fulva]
MATQKKTLDNLKNKKLLKHTGLINGEWIESTSGKATFDVIDPATLDKLATLPEMDKTDVAKAVDAAYEAFKTWKKTTARERPRMLRKWSDLWHGELRSVALRARAGDKVDCRRALRLPIETQAVASTLWHVAEQRGPIAAVEGIARGRMFNLRMTTKAMLINVAN